MSTVLSVSGINNPGPKATAVAFVVDPATGMRPWAWLPNAVAAQLRPGSRLIVPVVREGEIETHRSDDPTVALVRPKVQLWLSRTPEQKIVILPPEGGVALTEDDFEVAEGHAEFTDKVDAKAERAEVAKAVDGSEPF